MRNTTLIAYASKHGSTAEVAKKISELLLKAEIKVDVIDVKDNIDVKTYNNIIIGSAVYIGQWQKKAAKFLKENEKSLADKSVWLFSTGPTGEGDPVKLMKGWKFPEGLQSIADKIKPHDVAIFHGVLDETKLNTLEKMTVKMVKAPFGDFRDWEAIEEWANEIIKVIKHGANNSF